MGIGQIRQIGPIGEFAEAGEGRREKTALYNGLWADLERRCEGDYVAMRREVRQMRQAVTLGRHEGMLTGEEIKFRRNMISAIDRRMKRSMCEDFLDIVADVDGVGIDGRELMQRVERVKRLMWDQGGRNRVDVAAVASCPKEPKAAVLEEREFAEEVALMIAGSMPSTVTDSVNHVSKRYLPAQVLPLVFPESSFKSLRETPPSDTYESLHLAPPSVKLDSGSLTRVTRAADSYKVRIAGEQLADRLIAMTGDVEVVKRVVGKAYERIKHAYFEDANALEVREARRMVGEMRKELRKIEERVKYQNTAGPAARHPHFVLAPSIRCDANWGPPLASPAGTINGMHSFSEPSVRVVPNVEEDPGYIADAAILQAVEEAIGSAKRNMSEDVPALTGIPLETPLGELLLDSLMQGDSSSTRVLPLGDPKIVLETEYSARYLGYPPSRHPLDEILVSETGEAEIARVSFHQRLSTAVNQAIQRKVEFGRRKMEQAREMLGRVQLPSLHTALQTGLAGGVMVLGLHIWQNGMPDLSEILTLRPPVPVDQVSAANMQGYLEGIAAAEFPTAAGPAARFPQPFDTSHYGVPSSRHPLNDIPLERNEESQDGVVHVVYKHDAPYAPSTPPPPLNPEATRSAYSANRTEEESKAIDFIRQLLATGALNVSIPDATDYANGLDDASGFSAHTIPIVPLQGEDGGLKWPDASREMQTNIGIYDIGNVARDGSPIALNGDLLWLSHNVQHLVNNPLSPNYKDWLSVSLTALKPGSVINIGGVIYTVWYAETLSAETSFGDLLSLHTDGMGRRLIAVGCEDGVAGEDNREKPRIVLYLKLGEQGPVQQVEAGAMQ